MSFAQSVSLSILWLPIRFSPTFLPSE
jgi:hypothetical protein